MNVAATPAALSWSTWSFIKEMSGDTTTARPGMAMAGAWKHSDFPPPVGSTTTEFQPLSFHRQTLTLTAGDAQVSVPLDAELTGAQLSDLFDDAILGTTTYSYLNIEPIVDYPALSGMTAFLAANGQDNDLRLPDGSAPDPAARYRVVISRTIASPPRQPNSSS